MAKAKIKKKNSTAKAQSVETRIVEVSLQHPKLGARRLAPFLKKKRLNVSAVTIQNILRSHGLQNRERRLAKVKAQSKKVRKPKRLPKKAMPKIAYEVAERICEISLQNPDLGAKRLAPLLKEKGISVSSSAVYRILKHHELHTRAKRYAEAAEITSEPVIIPKRFSEKIPPEVEKRIVEISLQNPECGARGLLPLLQQGEIFVSVSAVYRILKRHHLENRQKRFLKIETLKPPEAPPEPEIERPEHMAEALQTEQTSAEDDASNPVIELEAVAPVRAVDKAPANAKELEPTQEPAAAELAEPERPPARKPPVKAIKKRSHPAFYPLYLLLIVLIGYLGFHAFQGIQYALLETEAMTAVEPGTASFSVKAESAVSDLSLDGYRRIRERNLFNIAKTTDSGAENKIAIEEVAPAKKELGLKLVGTVAADNARLRRAFIYSSRTRGQRAYREGDAAGDVRIKKIQRNRVIVATAEGDRLLAIDIGGASGSSSPATFAQHRSAGGEYPQQIAGRRRPGRSFKLAREDVAASLADVDNLEQQLNIEPYEKDDQPAGFTIGKIPPESILRQMGLKSGNAIMGIDDEAIAGPEQAAEFFQKLAQGGEMSIKARIGRGVRRRTRYIHLNIQ